MGFASEAPRLSLMLLLICVLALPLTLACDDGGGDSCSPEVVRLTVTELGTTSTCGPEDYSLDPTHSTDGDVVTVGYNSQIMICGGEVEIDLDVDGNAIGLDESVVGGGECGCFQNVELLLEIELCGPGTYYLGIHDSELPVTI